VHDDELTVRRVFTIEYTCRIDQVNNTRRCHGWIFFRPRPSEERLKRSFRSLSQISGIIQQMVADAEDTSELDPGES